MSNALCNSDINYQPMPDFDEAQMDEVYYLMPEALTRIPRDSNFKSRFVRYLARRLKLRTERVLAASLDDLVGVNEPSIPLLRQVIHRATVNRAMLNGGIRVPSRPEYLSPSWVIAVVRGIEVQEGGKLASIDWLLVSGRMAGQFYRQDVTGVVAEDTFRVCVGWPTGYPYESPLQLFNLRALLSIGWKDGQFDYRDIGINKRKMRPPNIAITTSRYRKSLSCRFHVPVDCRLCRVGCNECRLSVSADVTKLVQRPYSFYGYVAHDGVIPDHAIQFVKDQEKLFEAGGGPLQHPLQPDVADSLHWSHAVPRQTHLLEKAS